MNKFLIIIPGLVMSFTVFPQKARQVSIPPGVEPANVFPLKDRYRFEEFISGYLVTMAGKRSQPLKLNFNLFSGIPQFINDKGDTLFIDDYVAKYVQIRELTYQHDFPKGYYELVLKTEPVKLAIQREWKFKRRDLISDSGYGVSTLSSGSQLSTVNTDTRTYQNQASVFERDSSYFFIDAKDRIYEANEASTLNLFSKHKKEIRDFFRQNTIDFKKETDLRKLFEFLIPLGTN